MTKRLHSPLLLSFILLFPVVSTHAVVTTKKELKLSKEAETIAYSIQEAHSKFASWGVSPKEENASINLINSWKIFEKKKDVIVAVIDTGIQYDHPFLKGNIYAPKGQASESNYGMDFSKDGKTSQTPKDEHGHGTHVSGIIKSIFPEVKIMSLKYYNPEASGQANLEATIRALKYAVDQNVDIINYSGGGPEACKEEKEILQLAEKKGILVIAAAGNEKSNIDKKENAYYPASYGLSNIITVGAYNQDMEIIPSSNWGKLSVDIAAPGHRIMSSIPGGVGGYMTGTSQATAFVTGVAALIKSQFPELKFREIKNSILSSSKKVPQFEEKIMAGGKLDALEALKAAGRVSSSQGRSLAKSN